MRTQIRPIEQRNIVGTSYAAVICCEFDVLEESLGTPNLDPTIDDKTTCSWNLSYRTDDGEWLVFTVYNYKDDTPPQENEMWHVGSNHKNDDALFEFLERILRCDIITRGRKK